MATASEQRHRSAHRVADGDDPLDAENIGQPRDVVGAVLKPERPR
jgi:hypothetical protein